MSSISQLEVASPTQALLKILCLVSIPQHEDFLAGNLIHLRMDLQCNRRHGWQVVSLAPQFLKLHALGAQKPLIVGLSPKFPPDYGSWFDGFRQSVNVLDDGVKPNLLTV